MVERPRLSRSELEVARIVWDRGEATVRDVHEALAERRDVDFTTVQTFLRRLEAKGYLKSTLQGRLRVFRALARPADVMGEVVRELIDSAFGGRSLPLLRHLIETEGMTADEIAELRRLLDQSTSRTDGEAPS